MNCRHKTFYPGKVKDLARVKNNQAFALIKYHLIITTHILQACFSIHSTALKFFRNVCHQRTETNSKIQANVTLSGVDHRAVAVSLTMIVLMSGCASQPERNGQDDPWEDFNRGVYQFNDQVDKAIFKPVSKAYIKITSRQIRTGVTNFFDNVGYPNVVLNDALQGKAKLTLADTTRFVVNSTFGILGLFDVASRMGLEYRDEDFGQTLAVWHVPQGNYLVLPFFGPSTIRDVPRYPVAAIANVLFFVGNTAVTIPLGILYTVNTRANATGAFEFINEAAVDPYAFTREAYLQNRRYLIYNGNPPPPEFPELELPATP